MNRQLFIVFFLFCFQSFANESWSEPTTVYASNGKNAQLPLVSLHNTENSAAAIWISEEAEVYSIQTSLYNGTSWAAPSTLAESSNLPGYHVKINQDQSAIAVWDGFNEQLTIAASICTLGNWGAPVQIANLGNDYFNPLISFAANPEGVSVVNWKNESGSHLTKTYNFSTGTWSDSYSLSEGFSLSSALPIPLAISSENLIIAILFSDAGVYESENNALSPLQPPTHSFLAPYISSNLSPQMTFNALKNRQAFLFKESNNRYLLAAVSQPSGWKWSVALKLDSNNLPLSYSISLNPNNQRFIAAWQLQSGSVQASIYNGIIWTPPITLSESGSSPSVAFNPITNHAVAVWVDLTAGGSGNSIKLSEWDGNIWSDSTSISATSSSLGGPSISFNSNGDGIILWHRLVDSYSIIEFSSSN